MHSWDSQRFQPNATNANPTAQVAEMLRLARDGSENQKGGVVILASKKRKLLLKKI